MPRAWNQDRGLSSRASLLGGRRRRLRPSRLDAASFGLDGAISPALQFRAMRHFGSRLAASGGYFC